MHVRRNSLETQLDHLNETLQNVQQQLAREKEFRRAAEERVAKINGLLKESETAHQQELGILEEALVEQKENLTKATDQVFDTFSVVSFLFACFLL